jgi:hypothetical protein
VRDASEADTHVSVHGRQPCDSALTQCQRWGRGRTLSQLCALGGRHDTRGGVGSIGDQNAGSV